MKKLRAGVIGLGVGERHVVGYNEIDNVEVVSVCDIDPEKLKDVADRRQVEKRHTDYRKVVEDPDIDMVSICSYDDAHVEQCVAAFENGKHVFVEKPVALTRKGAEKVLRAKLDSGKKISSNLILRQSPRFIEMKQRVDAGEFGEIVTIEGDYIHEILWKIVTGWRAHMDFYCVTYGGGIHMIDLMSWIVDHKVESVFAMGNKMLTGPGSFGGGNFKYPDTMFNLLQFENGTMGKNLTHFGPQRTKFHALNIYGTKKTFINDLPHGKLFDGDQPENEYVVKTPYPGVEKGDMLPDFVSAIRENREPNLSTVEMFRLLDVCIACWESQQKNRPVIVDYLL